MRVVFVHDLSPPLGGAEVSILHLLGVAKERGIEVVLLGRGQHPVEADVVVMSGLDYFQYNEQARIIKFYYARKYKWVVWDHHVGDGGMDSVHRRRVFSRANQTIFVSPLHLNTRLRQYKSIHTHYVLPVGVGPQDFNSVVNVQREPNHAVCMMSRILSKGRRLLDRYIGDNPELNIEIYAEFDSPCPNVVVHGPINRDQLPVVYSTAHYNIDLPCRITAGGNATYEGVLCGCEPVYNHYVGATSWSWDWKNPELLRQKLIEGNLKFWDIIVS